MAGLFLLSGLFAVGTRAVPGSAAARLRQSCCYVVCLFVVVTLLVSVTIGTFNVVQMIAPGVTGAHNRDDAFEALVPLVVLALGAAALFRVHWSRVDPPPFLRPEVEPATE